MKKLILNNWAAKIASLVLAFTLWFLINKKVGSAIPLSTSAQPIVQIPEQPQIEEQPVIPEPTPDKASPQKTPHAKPNH